MKRIFLTVAIFCSFFYSSIYGQGRKTVDFHKTAPTKFIDVNGTKYAYRTFGNKTGMPLIFLQHFTGTMDNWDPMVTNGFAKDFQVILFDNKGIGSSTGETPLTIEAMSTDAISFIKALGLKKVNLLGFSMGGFIAQQMILDESTLIDKVILAGTGPKGGQGIADIVKPLTNVANMNPNDQKLYLFYTTTPYSRALGEQAQLRINGRTENRDPDTKLPSIQAQLQAILNWGASDSTALNKLAAIKQRVLVINGSNDIVVPTINSYTLFQNISNAKLSLYPDSGHGSIFQYPNLFLTEAISFLKTK